MTSLNSTQRFALPRPAVPAETQKSDKTDSSSDAKSGAGAAAGAAKSVATSAAKAAGAAVVAAADQSDGFVRAQKGAFDASAKTGAPTRKHGPVTKSASDAHLMTIGKTFGPQVSAEIRKQSQGVLEKSQEGSKALGPAGEGVASAMSQSTERVLAGLAQGKMKADEAKAALDQLDVVASAMKMVKDGNLPNLQRGGVNLLDKGVKTLNFDVKKGNDTFTVQLLARSEPGYGEARVGFSVLAKNGETLPMQDQVSVRVDHQRVDGTVAVDVASSLLDSKVHGPMLDEDGKPIKNGKIPDHHFKTALPKSLDKPEEFARFVKDFEKKYVEPKEASLGKPKGIEFQTDNKVSAGAITDIHGKEMASELSKLNDEVDGVARSGSGAFGDAGKAIASAIDTTTDRILGRVAAGTLSPDDAKKAMGETKLMASMIAAVKDGKMGELEQGGKNLTDPTFEGYKFKMKHEGEEYTVKVTTRAEQSSGEARVALNLVEKNGEKLSRFEQVGIRVDLQKFDGKVAVDIDSSLLDRSVHGAMDPSHTDGKTGIPDHHFKDDVPSSLAKPENFAQFVNEFRGTYLKPEAAD